VDQIRSLQEGAGGGRAAHVVTEVGHVIVDSLLQQGPLVGAALVFASAVAHLDVTSIIFVHFTSDVMILNRDLGRKVRNRVSVMSDSVLVVVQLLVRESVVGVITDSGLSKVDHAGGDVVCEKIHASHLSQSASKTVTSGLNRVGREECLKSLYLCLHFWVNTNHRILESFMDLTLASRPSCVICLESVEVSNPVRDGRRSSEDNIN
jgi:hypothetical protein